MQNSKKILTAVGFLSVASLLAGCGSKASEEDKQDHVHTLTHHAAVASTCVTHGTIEYWSCEGCEGLFSDENGANQITSVEAPLGAHVGVHHDAVPATCLEKGNVEYWECSVCEHKFSDSGCTTEVQSVETELGDHAYVYVPEVPAQEGVNGTLAHYKCSECDALFKKVGEEYQSITAEELVIPMLVYYDVTFDYAGISSQHIIAGGKVTAPDVTPTKEADDSYTYTFKEWQLDGQKFDFATDVVSADIQLKPAFDKVAKEYKLTFKVQGKDDVVVKFTCETESIDVPELPEAPQGYSVAWSSYSLETLADQEVTVVTSPRTDTAYKVNHYLPKLDGTGYELYDTEDKTGTTAADTAASAMSIVGFTAGEITQEKIAADGSTVVDIYYTRNELKLAKDNDTAETTIEMVENGLPSHQKVTLKTNEWGIAWTSLVPNFTKAELEAADGIEFVVKLPQAGTMMCSNSNQFAKNIAGGNFQVVRLSKADMLNNYHEKHTIDDIYNHMIYSGSRGMGFLFSSAKNAEVSIELLSAGLYKGELSPLANKHLNGHTDQAQESVFVNASNIAKFTDAPALPEGADGMLRVQTAANSYGVSDFRINPTGLVSKEEMLESSEIVMKVYAVAGEGKPTTFNAYLNNEHFQKDNATGSWIDVKIPTRLIGVQEKTASLSAAYDAMVGGYVRMPEFQFKLNGSAFTGGNVVFYVAGVKAVNKISTLINTKQMTGQTVTTIDQSNIGQIDGAPALPSGKQAMVKVDATSNQYGVTPIRFDTKNFFTEAEIKAAQTLDVLMYMKKGTADTFTVMLKDTEQFNKGLAVNQWVTVSIPVQLLLSQITTTYDQQVGDGWINFMQILYDKNAATTFYVGGVSLNNGPQINASNASKVMFIESDQGKYTNTWITSANKGANDPAMPEGYSGYVKLDVTTDQYGLCDIRFASGLINAFNFKHGSKISFKLFCTGEGIDPTVAMSMDNSHNYGAKNANEWFDFEYDLADFGDSAKRAERCDEWIRLCRVQFKQSGAGLNKGPVTIYLADVCIK